MMHLGLHSGHHDACACLYDDYKLVAAVALERLTRRKLDGGRLPVECIDECLAIAGARRQDIGLVALSRAVFPARYYTHLTLGRRLERWGRSLVGREKTKTMERELPRAGTCEGHDILDSARLLADLDLAPTIPVHFYNHHFAHALPTLFHTDWPEALLVTADGGGDNVQYSCHLFRHGRLDTLDGGDAALLDPTRIDSLGLFYGYATQALGWKINRHEGKLTGLAASGTPSLAADLGAHFRVDGDGRIDSDFATYSHMRQAIVAAAATVGPEDMAASVQKVLEDVMTLSLGRRLARHKVRHLGVSGGVFANVRLNQKLLEDLSIDDIFVYPAMGDQGLAAGGVLDALLARDGLTTWLARRQPLEHLYLGRDYTGTVDDHFAGEADIVQVSDDPVAAAATHLAQGKAVAIYTGAMEYGPRALGARSILASPADKAINQSLNDRLDRSDFMPFAPVVAAADADAVFDLPDGARHAARFMTITCPVRPEWRDRIAATVHVDGTARPQIIDRTPNPLYFDILAAFKQATGLPVLINTSFNVHEEPIINTPAECARALIDGRVDFVVTTNGLYARRG